jgi:carboxypeptidase family protein/TonB-dependent receptor-like protein
MRLRTVTCRMVWLLAMALLAGPAAAQDYTGRIEVSLTDTTGAVLPGVSVEVSGPRRATTITDGQGNAQFLNLPPGTYEVLARLAGFRTYRNTNVPVAVGSTVPLKVALNVESVAQDVFVTAESPVVDTKRQTTQTNVTLAELQEVPSSRDPWVVLQTVPGVIVDRVNVGGAESGQQSNYQAKGAASAENTWNIDGIPITDMAALGSTPTYYDFDMFQEMQVVTGGAALQNATPGVALNFVLKGGTNTPHGSSRVYFENESMQSTNLPDDLKAALGGTGGKGNRIDQYSDYGFELGGPIWKDRIWAWGALGKTDVRLLTLASTPDRTILKNSSFKTSAQVTQDLRGSFTFFRGDKLKYGRSAGPTRPPETTLNQKGPTPVYKGEVNYVLGSQFFLAARVGHVGGGFSLSPQGGLDKQWYIDDGASHRGSNPEYATVRPQHNVAVEGNFFKGRHEVRFGYGWRRADTDSTSTVPGNAIVTYHDGYPNMIAEVTAWGHVTSTRGLYTNAYIGDTITANRLTINLGLRWDRQAGSVKELAQAGNSILPTLLPDITGAAAKDVVVWSSVTPRVGIAYALDKASRTVARASYGSFASQLNATAGGFLSTVQYRGVYFYDVVDRNGNRAVDAPELAGLEVGNWYGFDIANPGNVSTPIHKVGSYKTPLTHEVQFGLDRELAKNFGLSGTVTWRNFTNHVWRNNGLRASDYTQISTFTGTQDPVGAFSVPVYGVIPARIPANRAATTYQSRDGYSQRYLGFELAATKRMSNRWMARLAFSTNDHREYFDGPEAKTDPTSTLANPNIDGGTVMRSSGGSGKSGIYQVLPKFQYIATGVYQAPKGINLGVNLVTRQGFAMPYNRTQVVTTDPIARNKTLLLVGKVTDFRLPTATSLDARVGKELQFGRTKFNVDLDLFNLMNSSTILGRQYDLRVTTANNVLEVMNPRVLRVGLRFNF